MKTLKTLLVFLFLISSVAAQAGDIYIPVGQAKIKKSLLAFPDVKYLTAGMDSGDSKGIARQVKEIISNDLNFTNLFTFQSPGAFIEKAGAGLTLDTFSITDWSTIGTEFLIKTGISITGNDVAFEMRLFDVLGTKQILGKRYVAKANEPKILAHTVANELVEALTGRPGIFFTKLAMVCDKSGQKEIWVTDFDGSNPKQVTHHRTLSFAPAWSPDNKKIAYSLYTKNAKNVKNIDLYEHDVQSGQSRLLSNRHGINSGAAYSPNGRGIALTMSFLGNPEIFMLDPLTREVTRLTKSLGFDVDPSFSPDGKQVAFVSSRSHQPMVYVAGVEALKANPHQATRLTFAGIYNATPNWSPTNNKMVFAGDLGSHFDLFIMNPDATNLERLTKDEGNNENPFFSPDGGFIAFDSNRTGQKNVYVITVDGTNTRRISFGLGNCEAPKWSSAAKMPF